MIISQFYNEDAIWISTNLMVVENYLYHICSEISQCIGSVEGLYWRCPLIGVLKPSHQFPILTSNIAYIAFIHYYLLVNAGRGGWSFLVQGCTHDALASLLIVTGPKLFYWLLTYFIYGSWDWLEVVMIHTACQFFKPFYNLLSIIFWPTSIRITPRNALHSDGSACITTFLAAHQF